MRPKIVVIWVVILVFSCKSVKQHNQQINKLLTVIELKEDVDKLYTQLKRHHPKLYQFTPKDIMEFKFDSLKKTINSPINSRDFYKKLAPVLTSVKQGHVSIRPLGKRFKRKTKKALLEKKFEFYDLDFNYRNNKLYVERTVGKDSTLIGAQVLSIAGESSSRLIKTYKTRFASDGFNTTLYNRFVGKGFKVFYVRDKGFLDSLQITFKINDSIFKKVFKRIPKKKKSVSDSSTIQNKSLKTNTPKKLSKQKKDSLKSAFKLSKKYRKTHGYIARSKEYTRNFNFKGKDSSIAYIKIRSFTNGNYKKFYKTAFKKIDSANTKYLILDLRNNGGGRIAEIALLYSYLVDKKFKFISKSEVNSRLPVLNSIMSNTTPLALKIVTGIISPLIIAQNLLNVKKKDGKLYYALKNSKTQAPNPLNFKGKIYVLINGNSFSASSLISTNLHATKRATFIGEETGGAYNGTVAGLYKIYQLPNSKLIARIGLMQVEAPYKQTPNGYGIKPNIAITPTYQDALLQKDSELEWVLKDIKNSSKL